MEEIKSEPKKIRIKTERDVIYISKFDDCEDEMEYLESDDSDTSTICNENRNDDIDVDFNKDQIMDREINANIDDIQRALIKAENMETNVKKEIDAKIDDTGRQLFKAENLETKIEVGSCQITQEEDYVEPESDSSDHLEQQSEIPVQPSEIPVQQMPVLEFKSDDTFDNLYKARVIKKY